MFYIDLDELTLLNSKIKLFGYNTFNLYNFRDKDHLQLNPWQHDINTKENIIKYLANNKVNINEIGKIKLLTNLVTAGYIFNPVSFYYVFDNQNKPLCAVVEICNTFHELKPYFIAIHEWNEKYFENKATKYFYVSPFIQHNSAFHFRLQIPSESLTIHIDDLIDDEIILKTRLQGKKAPLSDRTLLFYFLSIPFITFKIIIAIHFQALVLWMKNLKYYKKADHIDLQR